MYSVLPSLRALHSHFLVSLFHLFLIDCLHCFSCRVGDVLETCD
ncbi:hypothetical protein M6B38_206620 [Iris pallida]|uniref:Uncharacterized protein n=1 Tax=Iris pallida TaxID=29817 RepID=A0AAX6E6C5_IRIPA|nr:hypothetical protein M6B38_206620 [Iris pallida]